MVNYQNSTIYVITSIKSIEEELNLIYICSTTKKYLSTKLSQHKASINNI